MFVCVYVWEYICVQDLSIYPLIQVPASLDIYLVSTILLSSFCCCKLIHSPKLFLLLGSPIYYQLLFSTLHLLFQRWASITTWLPSYFPLSTRRPQTEISSIFTMFWPQMPEIFSKWPSVLQWCYSYSLNMQCFRSYFHESCFILNSYIWTFLYLWASHKQWLFLGEWTTKIYVVDFEKPLE